MKRPSDHNLHPSRSPSFPQPHQLAASAPLSGPLPRPAGDSGNSIDSRSPSWTQTMEPGRQHITLQSDFNHDDDDDECIMQKAVMSICHLQCRKFVYTHEMPIDHHHHNRFLWSPYVIGQTIIFSCCLWPPYVIGGPLYFCPVISFYLFFSSPNLNGRRSDVCHTSTHGMALVRI